MVASVVIPIRNRPQAVESCLDALDARKSAPRGTIPSAATTKSKSSYPTKSTPSATRCRVRQHGGVEVALKHGGFAGTAFGCFDFGFFHRVGSFCFVDVLETAAAVAKRMEQSPKRGVLRPVAGSSRHQ